VRVSIFLAAAFIAFGATPVSAQVEMTVPGPVASRRRQKSRTESSAYPTHSADTAGRHENAFSADRAMNIAKHEQARGFWSGLS
jgi:hypothetical protein